MRRWYLFPLFVGLSGFLFPAAAFAQAVGASQPAQAQALIVQPLSLAKEDDLDFGALIVTTAGTATINPTNGTLGLTGGLQRAGGAPRPARFIGAARRASIIWIRFPRPTATLRRVGGTQTLTVDRFTLDGGALRIVGAGPVRFAVGGRLTVPPGTMDGEYVGDFEVTINYF